MTLDEFIARYSTKGWQVISRTDSAVQMRRPKRWSQGGLLLGLFTIPLWGAGFVLLFITLIDYLFQQEKVGYVTADNLKTGTIPPAFLESKTDKILLYIFIAVVLIGCGLYTFMRLSSS